MIFLTAQPDSDYYIWQLKVQMVNFRKLGIEQDAVILLGYKTERNPNAIRFKEQTKANVIFIEDTRKNVQYIPTIRPHLIKKFYKEKIELIKNQSLFYLDSDVIFREVPDFERLENTNKISMSDTISYVGSDYIISKSETLLNELCGIVGIDPKIVKLRNEKSGGAQIYIPKLYTLTYEFWDNVESNSEKLYKHMKATEKKYSPNHPIQAWVADMWALLWEFWKFGAITEINDELSFCWATSPITEWKKNKILHNAGVISDNENLFYKASYVNKSPFEDNFDHISKKHCSYKYVQEIMNAKKKFK